MSEGVSEVSERETSECSVGRVRSEQSGAGERCERMSERTSEWHMVSVVVTSRFMAVLTQSANWLKDGGSNSLENSLVLGIT